jgi:hypothetical protein
LVFETAAMGIAIVESPESHANVSRHERLAPEAVFLWRDLRYRFVF